MDGWGHLGHGTGLGICRRQRTTVGECSVLSTIPRIHGQARAPSGQQTTEL